MPINGFDCDSDPVQVRYYAERASLGGAGYINKTKVAKYSDGTLNTDVIGAMNLRLHLAFCLGNYYYEGLFRNSYVHLVAHTPGIELYEDENTYTIIINTSPGAEYWIDIQAYNYGTTAWERQDQPAITYHIYDSCKNPSESSAFAATVSGLDGEEWASASMTTAQSSGIKRFFYTAPQDGKTIYHEYYVIKKSVVQEAFGDILKVAFVVNVE